MHFNVHMDPAKGETVPEDLSDVILGEILYAQNNTDAVLSDVVIDEDSLDIQGKRDNATLGSMLLSLCDLLNNQGLEFI